VRAEWYALAMDHAQEANSADFAHSKAAAFLRVCEQPRTSGREIHATPNASRSSRVWCTPSRRICNLFNSGRNRALIPRFMLAVILVGGTLADAQSGPDLTWTQHPKLTWNDFRGRPPQSPAYPSAESDTGFKYELLCRNGLLDIDAAAFFSPSGSWVKPSDKTAELLRHEQGHFDMAELYALKLRKAVRDSQFSCQDRFKARAAGEKMAGDFQRDWENAEREYEDTTREGRDVKQQDAASSRIAAGLAALNAYQQ